MTLPQRSRNDQRTDTSSHVASKVKRALATDKRAQRNFDNALRSKNLDALVDDAYPYNPVDLSDIHLP